MARVKGAARGGRPVAFRAFVAREAPAAAKIDAIRAGIDAGVVNDMVRYLHVSKGEIFDVLLTPASTAHRLIKEKRLVLYVPSAIIPEELNGVVNPHHPEFTGVGLTIERPFHYDPRLFRRRGRSQA